jgi:hypothetical protein
MSVCTCSTPASGTDAPIPNTHIETMISLIDPLIVPRSMKYDIKF